jgi:hypothetical protein
VFRCGHQGLRPDSGKPAMEVSTEPAAGDASAEADPPAVGTGQRVRTTPRLHRNLSVERPQRDEELLEDRDRGADFRVTYICLCHGSWPNQAETKVGSSRGNASAHDKSRSELDKINWKFNRRTARRRFGNKPASSSGQ